MSHATAAAVIPELVLPRAHHEQGPGDAARCFQTYRTRGGTRTSTLPDFLIGAHAAVLGLTLLTRDATRYRTYFPAVRLAAPEDG
jgi:predicted nucleic acid-binding protein